jgi:uncharacterized protein with ParB-like and HNH nuclease domain
MSEYQKMTIRDAVEKINRTIFLPDIQRPFVWEKEQIEKLFDSLMRRYPINTLLYWELSRDEILKSANNETGNIKLYKFVSSNADQDKSVEEKNRDRDDYSLVLDGQQRLTALYISLKGYWIDETPKKKIEKELYHNVLSGKEADDDGIQFEFDFIDRKKGIAFLERNKDKSVIKLWLNIKRIYEENNLGKTSDRGEYIKRLCETNQDLEQYSGCLSDCIGDINDLLRAQNVINYFPEKESKYNKVLDIFVRTNSGGTKLGYSDLLFSTLKFHWLDARNSFEELLKKLNAGKNYDFDNDFILKSCLLIYSNKAEEVRYNIENLNKSLVQNVRTEWDDKLTPAFKSTVDLLTKYYLTDRKVIPSYNALIPIIYWIFKKSRKFRTDNSDDRNELDNIRIWLIKALLGRAFGSHSDTTLYNCKEAINSSNNPSFPASDIESKIKMPSLNEKCDSYAYQSKESYLFLSLCYSMSVQFQTASKGNLPEQDHIFSQDELGKAGKTKNEIMSIYNIRLVTMRDNRTKGADTFSDWSKNLGEHKEDIFNDHRIPPGNWDINNYDKFLLARKEFMLKKMDYLSS